MEIFISYDILTQLGVFLTPQSLYCLYMTFCSIPGSEETQANLRKLIIYFCCNYRPGEKFQYIDVGREEQYQETLIEFCALRKGREYKSTPEIVTRVRELFLPIYVETSKDFNWKGTVRIGSLELVQKNYLPSRIKEKRIDWNTFQDIFTCGNREITFYLLPGVPLNDTVVDIFTHAVSNEPVLENFNMVMEKIESLQLLNVRRLLTILSVCCRNTLDESIIEPLFKKIGTRESQASAYVILDATVRSGRVSRFENCPNLLSLLNTNGDLQSLLKTAARLSPANIDIRSQMNFTEMFSFLEDEFEKKTGECISTAYVQKHIVFESMRSDSLPMLKYLHEKYRILDIPLDEFISKYTIAPNCLRYVLEQCQPLKQDKVRLFRMFMRNGIQGVEIETLEYICNKFGHLIDFIEMLKLSMSGGRQDLYRFWRDKIPCLDKLSKENIQHLFHNLVARDDLEMFFCIKSDLWHRIPKFPLWWPEIEKSILHRIADNGNVHVVEHYLANVLSQEERNQYLLEQVKKLHAIHGNSLSLMLDYATNITEVLKSPSTTPDHIEFIEDNLRIKAKQEAHNKLRT